MRQFKSKQETWLKKSTKPASELKSGQKHLVPANKIIKVDKLDTTANKNYFKVQLAYGAGEWLMFHSHFSEIKPKTNLGNGTVSLQNIPQGATKTQVVEALVEECRRQGVTRLDQVAYVLATAEWESQFKPVREAFWMSEAWRKANFRYYPYYGRGFVQLTWKSNYAKYSKIMGRDLVRNPDAVMNINVALFIIVHGMKTGSFTGRGLNSFKRNSFAAMRLIVNPGEYTIKRLHHKNQNFINAAWKWSKYLTRFKASKYNWLT